MLYEQGLGVEQNYQKAVEYYEKAIEQDNNSSALNNITNIYFQYENYKKYYYYFDLSIINNIEIEITDYEKLNEITIKELSKLYYKFKSSTLKMKILNIIFTTINPEKYISYAYHIEYIHIFLKGIKEGLFDSNKLHTKFFMIVYKEYSEKNKEKIEIIFNRKIPKLLSNTILEFL